MDIRPDDRLPFIVVDEIVADEDRDDNEEGLEVD
jgi:hypothetical protein